MKQAVLLRRNGHKVDRLWPKQFGMSGITRHESAVGMKGYTAFGFFLYYLCILQIASGQMTQPGLHVASFSMNGASGKVSFWEESAEPVISISVALVGLEPGNYTLAIHEKPMIYGHQPACDDALIGGVYVYGGDLTSELNVTAVPVSGNWTSNYTSGEISLTGARSITGRTLVLQEQSSQMMYCALIANSRTMLTAVARFDEPFAGMVTFRQERDNPGAETSIFVDLYDVTDPIAQASYAWRISSNTGYNHDMDLETRCAKTSSDVYNPNGTDTATCMLGEPVSCPVGYLVSKFGNITVEPIPSAVTYYFIDTNLPLSGKNSVIGKSLVFSDTTGNPVACSPVLETHPKSAKALFSVNNVSGTIQFSQDSPYDATQIDINLENLRGLAGGYHIHVLPPPPRTYASDQPASPQNVAGHFNPYNIGAAPPPGTGTNDQYEVGDLSGKFGLLTGLNNFDATFLDWNLPLFGRNSIIGRSLVIHKTEGDRWVYAAIGYPTKKKTVKAVFTSPTVGKIVMSQDIDDPYADTSIYIEMAYADGSATTNGHNWHVHTTAVANDYISDEGRCVSCAGHFNPFEAELGTSYDQCSPAFPQRCELGDLSKKHGQLTIANKMNTGLGKLFFTDTRLPLSGAYSVAGRSIVIHAQDGGSPRISCADLLEIPPMESTADLWSEGPVSGEISFQQDSVFDPVRIHVNVSGLSSVAGGWHVHVLPIDSDAGSAPCSPTSVQGHFNPFGIVGSPPYGTQDMYEMGDLSGKFGSFSGEPDSMDRVYYDTNLALIGPRSIIGRSLVVHKSADGSRWVCATLYRKTHEEDFIMRAKAEITATDYSGYVLLDIFYWTFRPGRVSKDKCLASASIFNPHQVAMDTDYENQCDTQSQFRCAVGDLTGKHGNISSTVQRAVYTDVNLPLAGQASVLGLPVHLTSTNTGQLACSTLVPYDGTGRVEYLLYPSTTTFDSYKFRQTLRDAMTSVDMWQVAVPQEPEVDPATGCAKLTFYFLGNNLDELDREFRQKATTDSLGEFSPTLLCKVDVDGGGSSHAPPMGCSVCTVLLVCIVPLLFRRSL